MYLHYQISCQPPPYRERREIEEEKEGGKRERAI
jgi:hypothetical protein